RERIAVVRPTQAIPGLMIGSPVWTGPSDGYLSYQWDTMWIPQDVRQTIVFEATATNNEHVSASVEFRIRVDRKIALKQSPEIIDPFRSGDIELHIQNMSNKAVKILSVTTNNRSYTIDDNVPPSIEPGKSERLLVHYSAQIAPTGASLALVL